MADPGRITTIPGRLRPDAAKMGRLDIGAGGFIGGRAVGLETGFRGHQALKTG